MCGSLFQRNPERGFTALESEVSGDPPTAPPDHLPRQTLHFVHPGTVPREVVLLVLTMSRKRYRFEHSLRSYLWYRTSSFTNNVPTYNPSVRDSWENVCFLCHAGTNKVTIFPGHFQANALRAPLVQVLGKTCDASGHSDAIAVLIACCLGDQSATYLTPSCLYVRASQ